MNDKLEGAEAQIQYLADYILREHSDAIVDAGAGVIAVNELTRLRVEVERLTEIHEQMKSYYCRCEDRLSSGLTWMFDEDRCEYCRLFAESAEFAGRE